jgi:hypothetical protein
VVSRESLLGILRRLSQHTARVTAKPAIAVGDPTFWRYAARITAQGSNKKVSSFSAPDSGV